MQYSHSTHPRDFSSSMGKALKIVPVVIVFTVFLFGCKPTPTTDPVLEALQTLQAHTATPKIVTIAPTNTSQPSPSPTEPPILVWLPGYLPEKMRAAITIPQGYALAASPAEASIALVAGKESDEPISQWIYTLVAPFPTITDGVSAEQLRGKWKGSADSPFKDRPLLMDENTSQVLTQLWGSPDPQSVQVIPSDELANYAWANRPAWAIIPFEKLDSRWKVLSIDGQSPIHKDFDPRGYLLNVPFTLDSKVSFQQGLLTIPTTNRDPAKLTTVAMTGVTAMVRATASAMEWHGITYPAGDIGSLLRDADIAHISNEIPFDPKCPFPEPTSENLVFCSDPRYIDLLKEVGTDVIELTGDHFMDHGAEATLYTLQMYKDLGWPYYGGGANAEEARQPVLFENNGNKIAFMGCNIGCEIKTAIPCTAIATDDHPGAAKCDFDYISSEIPKLRQDGYQVIFTFQHIEYYEYVLKPILQQDFQRVAQAGASVVSGSQAHQPHGFEFSGNTLIHYGLGNLFFDQWHFCADYACDDAFIDRHVFYDGQYINTELITIHFVDFAKPRLMTAEERANFLKIIFDASEW